MKGKAVFGLVSVVVLNIVIFSSAVFATEHEYDEVTTAIQQKNSSWTAQKNHIAGNKPAERKKRLGAIFPFPATEVKAFAPSSSTLSLPVKLDWRNYNNNNYVTPIKEQGTCGACWAFAATAALESKILITQNTPSHDMDLSEQVLVSCSDAGNCIAGSITAASDFLSNYGLPPESLYPYVEADGSCTTVGASWEASALAVAGWHLVKPEATTIKRALYNYGPLVALLAVHTDFYYYSSGIYKYAWGDFEGYHAALIVGYDDVEQCFVVKSSWGTDWGEKGYFRISYGEIDSPSMFGQRTIAYNTPISEDFPLTDGFKRGTAFEGDRRAGEDKPGATQNPESDEVRFVYSINGNNATATDNSNSNDKRGVRVPMSALSGDTPAIGGTNQMSVGSSQTLSVVGARTGESYSWAIVSGGGYLSDSYGDSVIYTAPIANPNCAGNPTITLSTGFPTAMVLDTFTIAVNGEPSQANAAHQDWTSCLCVPGGDYGGGSCSAGSTNWSCSGMAQASGPNSWLQCDVGYEPLCQTSVFCADVVPGNVVDNRTSAMKAAGCCPAALLDGGTIDFNQSRANSMGGGEGSCPNSPNIAAESAVNIKSGNLHFTLDIGDITLAFNSIDTYDGPLGRHWTYNYNHRLLLSESDETKLVLKTGDGNIITYYLSNGVFYPEFVSGDTSEIVKNPNGSYSQTMKNGTIYEFDTSGRIALIKGRNIYLVTYLAYYDNGFTIADPNGRVTILTVSDNRITAITPSGPGDRTYHLSYTNGLLTSVSDPLGNTWQYVYDSDGKLRSKSDPEGQTVSYTYDSLGRLWTATDPEGRTRSMVYDSVGKTMSRDKNDNYSTYHFDPAYTVKTAIQDDFSTTLYTYDARRNLTSVIARDGAATSYAYDERGNLTAVTTIVKITAEGEIKRVTSYGYNTLNQLTSITDANEHVTRFGYTGDDLTSKTEANGAVTQYHYDLKGNLIEVIAPPDDAIARTTTMTYDSNNNLHTITDPKGGVTTLSYDTAGNMTGIEIPSGSWTFEYNPLNQMVSATDAQGKTSLFTHNFRGDRLSATDAKGNTTHYSYNYRGQLVTISDALNQTTHMAYGQAGCSYTCGGSEKLTSVTDALGHITRFTYDTRGRLSNETDDQGKVITFYHDTRDNLTRKELPDGRAITTSHDFADQLFGKAFWPASGRWADAYFNYDYDDAGNLWLATNGNTFHWFEFDANNRITSVSTQPQSIVWYEYYLSGKRKVMLVPYDSAPLVTAGRLATFTMQTIC